MNQVIGFSRMAVVTASVRSDGHIPVRAITTLELAAYRSGPSRSVFVVPLSRLPVAVSRFLWAVPNTWTGLLVLAAGLRESLCRLGSQRRASGVGRSDRLS